MAIITSISRNNNNRQVQQIKMKERKEKKMQKIALKNKANWLKCSPKLIC
jgi:hypothetical protein